MMKGLFIAAILIMAFLGFSKVLIAVTEDWPPFEYIEVKDGTYVELGTDVEIMRKVLKEMGYDLKILWMPWARCLRAVMMKSADIIFTASKTPEREQYLYYPDQPLGYTMNVLFYRKGRNIKYETPEDLKGLKVAYVDSYYYGEEFEKLPLKFMPVENSYVGFKLLMRGRVDLVVEDINVGLALARRMGIIDEIDYFPKPVSKPSPQYAAFAKKPGYDKLAQEFSDRLREFKKTKEYYDILKKYGVIYF